MSSILIALSGGVDSSVAAWIIKQNNVCQAAVMRLFGDSIDVAACTKIARQLDIPLHVFDFSAEFQTYVIDPFVQMYLKGETPNPCILCNRHLKFDQFLSKSKELGISRIAAGHYAQVEYHVPTCRYRLKKALDKTKDQSYVLYTLTQEQLSQIEFPLGNLQKSEVRKIAAELSLVNAQQKESQDLCFVLSGHYTQFIEEYTGKRFPEGDFVDKTGKILGRHKGLPRYTIGQRKGLGIAAPAPYYVCAHDVKNNTVVLGSEDELKIHSLTAVDVNLITVRRIEQPMHVLVKVRYRQAGAWAMVRQIDTDALKIEFDEPQKGVALGQAAVLYDGDYVVGGGRIAERE